MSKSYLRIMYDKSVLNKPLIAEGFYDNAWPNNTYNLISGPIYEIESLKDFKPNSSILIYQPANIYDNKDTYDLPSIGIYYHDFNDGDIIRDNNFINPENFYTTKNYVSSGNTFKYSDPLTNLKHNNGQAIPVQQNNLTLNYMSTYNMVVVGRTNSMVPSKDDILFYPYLTDKISSENLPGYQMHIHNTDSSEHAVDSFNNHGLVGGREYTIQVTNNNKKDYTTHTIYFIDKDYTDNSIKYQQL